MQLELYVGGLAVSGGYRYPALTGVPFALIGFTLFLIFYMKYQVKYEINTLVSQQQFIAPI